MQNVKMSVTGDILTIEVNLRADYGPSSSGKTNIIGTTQGNAKVSSEAELITRPEGLDLGAMFVGLNVYKK